MKLLVVFLVVASPLCQLVGLALAAMDKSNVTNAFAFQRRLRAAVPIEPLEAAVPIERLEAAVPVKPLTSEAIVPALEAYGYPFKDFKAFISDHFAQIKPEGKKRKKRKREHTTISNPRFMSLLKPEFEDNVGHHVQDYMKADMEDDVKRNWWNDISYYLAVLEVADGSALKAASLIYKAMHSVRLNEAEKETTKKMQAGQYFSWFSVLKSVDDAGKRVFPHGFSHKWRNEVMKEYADYVGETHVPIEDRPKKTRKHSGVRQKESNTPVSGMIK
ncbi:hypothetical protein PsorP6_017999 [Peronosclerospora sorghi]|uniref:Uncharacterized protein n=1 Tax=Peronosclerospora sorghi TaxID=230839 RepID=A0ACC0WDS9_9STRA|nr:hypothetical protein PsorP6_017999 [Peronosclerospora sorghi]